MFWTEFFTFLSVENVFRLSACHEYSMFLSAEQKNWGIFTDKMHGKLIRKTERRQTETMEEKREQKEQKGYKSVTVFLIKYITRIKYVQISLSKDR